MIATGQWTAVIALVAWFVVSTLLFVVWAALSERRRRLLERRAAMAPVYVLRPRPVSAAHSRDVARALRPVPGGRR